MILYPVDEFDQVSAQLAAFLVEYVFQLTFAALCDGIIQQEKVSCCNGCAFDHPSQTEHSCLMIDQEEAWFLYFDQAVEKVDLAHVMTAIVNVCSILGFIPSDKWEGYLTSLPKLPRTKVYLTSLELKNSGNIVSEEDIEDRVIYAIYGQKRNNFSDLQSASYSNEEQRSTELTNENEKEGIGKKVDLDLDFVISEIQNLRLKPPD